MGESGSFASWFNALWGYPPFPWQQMLAERVARGPWPRALDLPTAAGKTACIDIAVYALAAQAEKPVWEHTAPRRIWFVVDRRIVVDEAFERARAIAEKLGAATEGPLKVVADRLREIGGTGRPLAVGRLRGGVLRDDGWARLPSQPAVITSTVDQLGSRLLFRGYGRSALAAPIFAGLAAHDSLILLDEAHLSVPFLQTLRAVERYRGEGWAERPLRTPFAFSILSATPPKEIPESAVFPGAERDAALDHPELQRRLGAAKPAELVLLKSDKGSQDDPLVTAAVEYATAFVRRDGRRRVAVIVNRVRTAEAIAEILGERHGDEMEVVLLTGRLRPFERDRLVERWKPVLRANEPQEPERPVVLVTTQCIEVGADFSFDGLVTEVASLDALRQRFGRLNRLGRLASVSAAVLAREEDVEAGAEPDIVYGRAMAECWRLLDELAETRGDGKGQRKFVDFGVGTLDARLEAVDDLAPYLAPAPDAPLLLPAHVDLLCQTSPRPAVEPDIYLYLHGVGRGEAEVRVAWRADLDVQDQGKWPEIAALCSPNSRETVGVPLYRLRRWLADGADGGGGGDSDAGDAEGAATAGEDAPKERIRPVLVWQGRDRSRVCSRASEIHPNDVVLLPASYGIKGLAQSAPDQALGPERLDIWEPSRAQAGKPAALRLQRQVLSPWLECPPLRALVELVEDPACEPASVREAIDAVLAYEQKSEEHAPPPPSWWLELLRKVRDGRFEQHPTGGLVMLVRQAASATEDVVEEDLFADDDDLLSATGREVRLDVHSALVARAVDNLVRRCLPEEFHEPLKTAAYWHDIGKLDERFQVMLRQGNELAVLTEAPLAKSAAVTESPERRRAIRAGCGLPEDFRHEMLSAQLAERLLPDDNGAGPDELVLHAVASHHGYGRPFAPVSPDPEPPPVRGEHGGITIEVDTKNRAAWPLPHTLLSGVSERFWRLTRRYGWWGLAYLEAILRLGDWYASRFMSEEVPEIKPSAPRRSSFKTTCIGDPLVLTGIDGANPLGFLAALGTLVVLRQGGYESSKLAWRRHGLAWRPVLAGLPMKDPQKLTENLADQLRGAPAPPESDQQLREAEARVAQKKREIKDKKADIKKRGLRGKERWQVIEEELAPLERELEEHRKAWLEVLRRSVPRPELALGKNIDCTEAEYRGIVEPLMESACPGSREVLDMLAAFCSTGCLLDSPEKRREGKLAPTPFAFISGSGHQHFLGTAKDLMQRVSPGRLQSTLFNPWTYEDEGLSMRWDPVEDRRYALMDRDPTANDNKPRTVWMANLLAYRALALFSSAPTRRGLATIGWAQSNENEPYFTWPLWSAPLDPDSIRSLLLMPELYVQTPDRADLHARGVEVIFRSRRIKVGTGTNIKINFSPAREV